MDSGLLRLLEASVACGGLPVHRIGSGAGHDAMILASRMPACMLFVRSPGGISHHPDEAVLEDDVAAALAVARRFLEGIGRSISCST
jgi:allantoate deiminase